MSDLNITDPRLLSILESSRDAIVCADIHGSILTWNSSAQRIFGYPEKEILGKDLQILFPQVPQTDFKGQGLLSLSKKAGNPEKPLEWIGVRKTRQDFPAEITVRAWQGEEEPALFTLVIHDITGRRRREEMVRQANIQTELLLSSIPSVLIGVGQSGLILHWNLVAESTFGIPGARVLNQPVIDCPIPWDGQAVAAGIQKCRNQSSPVRLDDVRFQRTNGQEGFLGFTVIPVTQEGRGMIECILFGADITERKKTEALKNEFVGIVSHELRSPLTIIKEGVSQVREGILGEINEKQKRFLTIAFEGIDRLGRIVDDLLDISKIEAGRFELNRQTVDLIVLVKEVTAAFRAACERKGLSLQTDCEDAALEAYVDRDTLVQVFTNLMDNALKFTDQGSIRVQVREHENVIKCSVADTGRGISGADMVNVFGKFQQFSRVTGPGKKGTGLGLSICKGIVELHGGQISVESRFGEGTRFFFSIPKQSAIEFFKQRLSRTLEETIRNDSKLSFIALEAQNFDSLQNKMEIPKLAALMARLEEQIRQNIHQRIEIVSLAPRAIFFLFPGTLKEDALMAAGRIQQLVEDSLSKTELEEPIRFKCHVASFPEDGRTEEELLAKVMGG